MNDIEQTVQAVFAELTRYPLEILTPEAHLEEELGIDSVKLAEIFAVLQARFDLPDIENLPLEQMNSIAAVARGITEWKQQPQADVATRAPMTATSTSNGHVRQASGAATAERASHSSPHSASLGDPAEVERTVQEVFAELTRYPPEILTPEAHLEEELGIDSVKLAEIFAVLQARFGLPKVENLPLEQMNSISAIAEAIVQWAQSEGAPTSPEAGTATQGAATELPRRYADYGGRAEDESNGNVSATPVDGVAWAEQGSMSPGLATPHATNAAPADSAPVEPSRPTGSSPLDSYVLPWLAKTEPDSPYVANAETNGSVRSAPWTKLSGQITRQRPPAPTPFYAPHHQPFRGRVALVTGAGHGIGKQIALELASLGAAVVVNSFHSRSEGEQTTQQILADGGEATHVWGSVANAEQHEAIFQQIERRYGGLDFFVSNASNGIIAPLEYVSEAHWDRAFRTNVVGLHRGAMFASKLMRERGGGKILTISSPGAQRYIEHFGCMGPVKAAVESLVRYLSIELGPYNIQVNAISAGPIYGDLLRKYPEGERLVPYWESITLGNQLGNEKDLAESVMFFLSPISDKITGSVLLVDGGGSQRI